MVIRVLIVVVSMAGAGCAWFADVPEAAGRRNAPVTKAARPTAAALEASIGRRLTPGGSGHGNESGEDRR